MASVTYELRTAKGARICVYSERKLAIRDAEKLAERFPGLVVIEVTVPEPIERRVWSEARLRLVGAS